MKNSIESLLNAIEHDNKKYIIENGGNVAEYILTNADAQEFGWFEFLTEDEIADFENGNSAKYIEEITNYVNENFNYEIEDEETIRVDELIEKYIVVSFDEETEDRIRMTKRSNFEKQDFCKCYGNYGNQVGCYDAGCYSFDNSGCSIFDDFYSAISEKVGPFGSLMDDLEITTNDLVEWLSDKEESIAYKTGLEHFPDWAKMVAFFKAWREENETHTEVTAWTFHDSHNFKTVVLDTDFGEPDCTELDEAEQRAILAEYPGVPHIEGTNTSEETENYIFSFDLWATNPWICYVENK